MDDLIRNPRSPLEKPLIGLCVAAFFIGIAATWQTLAQATTWDRLPLAIVGAVVWAVISSTYLHHFPLFAVNRSAFRLAESVLLVVATRIFTLVLVDGFPPAFTWRIYLEQPLSILSVSWVIYTNFVLLSWWLTLRWSALFVKLGMSSAEIDFYQQVFAGVRNVPEVVLQGGRTKLHQGFQAIWLNGGVVLLLMASLTTIDREVILTGANWRNLQRLPLPSLLIWSLLLYFLIGFWLTSYGRYMVVYTRWLDEGAIPHKSVAPLWRRMVFVVLVGIALVSAFLPIGSTFPIATMLWRAVTFVISLLIFVGQALIFLIMGLLSVLFSPFGAPTETVPPPALPTIPPLVAPPTESPPPTDLIPDEVTGGLFWIVVLVSVLAALLFILRQRGYPLPTLGKIRMQLRLWWETWRRVAQAQLASAGDLIRSQIGLERKTATKSPFRFVRINGLSPREQIRYFYLATVRRAGEQGIERKEGETPTEFLEQLQEAWPDSAENSQHLTEAFHHARYSPDPVEKEHLPPIKKHWKRVRSDLRRKNTTDQHQA